MKTFTEKFASQFKKSYRYKMGGTQTIIMPNGQEFEFNDKKYYTGRGAKYNSNILHDEIGQVLITDEQIKDEFMYKIANAGRRAFNKYKEIKKKHRIEDAKKNGLYSIEKTPYGTFIELSNDERDGQYFDADRLSATLKIKKEDASLLTSMGKTYVFARSTDGTLYMLYHSSLSCNNLLISIEKTTEERFNEFKNDSSWHSARYAAEVGNSFKNNHFVC